MQYIGVVFAVGVWVYFEFYRIPRMMEDLRNLDNVQFAPVRLTLERHGIALGNCQDAFDEIWEKLDEFDQKFDVGTKQAPKAVSRN